MKQYLVWLFGLLGCLSIGILVTAVLICYATASSPKTVLPLIAIPFALAFGALAWRR